MVNIVDSTVQDGRPIELFTFLRGNGRFDFADRELIDDTTYTYDSIDYTPAYIKRSNIEQTEDVFKNPLTIMFDRQNDFANSFLGTTKGDVTSITIFREQYGNMGAGSFETIWKGRVLSGKIKSKQINLECESIFSSIKRPGLRARFERNCRHALYDQNCRVDKELFKELGSVTSITNGIEIEVSAISGQPTGTFKAGMIKNTLNEFRFIVDHQIGGFLRINRPFDDLSESSIVEVFPGCDHTSSTCINRFNNFPNNGGAPYIPLRNPFNGKSLT